MDQHIARHFLHFALLMNASFLQLAAQTPAELSRPNVGPFVSLQFRTSSPLMITPETANDESALKTFRHFVDRSGGNAWAQHTAGLTVIESRPHNSIETPQRLVLLDDWSSEHAPRMRGGKGQPNISARSLSRITHVDRTLPAWLVPDKGNNILA